MKKNYGYYAIVAASVLWGTMGIFAKFAFEYEINPVTLIALRSLIGSVTIFIPILLFKRRLLKIQRKDSGMFLVLGFFAVALQRITYFYAIDLTTVTMAAVLFYTYPIFVTIYATLFKKERITTSTILAIILTFTGAALVVKTYDPSRLNANLLGITFGIISSILFALYFLLAKKLRKHYTNWTLVLYGDGIGALTMLPILVFYSSQIVGYSQQLWQIIFAIAWFPSILAYLIYSYALKHIESAKGSILSVIEPISAAIFSATILHENFEPPQLIGVALALTGVILLFYKPKRNSQ
jgi:drug/metabolite transporter (DMT)-like permease